jgi:hypothetical protein
MLYIKACVVPLSKRELAGAGKAADRAFDSRSCANLIKEGYQGVKRIVAKAAKQQQQSSPNASGSGAAAAAAGKNPSAGDEWSLSEAAASTCAAHRDMLPSLQLMAVGFDNLAPAYHVKIAKSNELGLNLPWLLKFADHALQHRFSGSTGGSGKAGGGKASPDKSSSVSSTGGDDDRSRGRQRIRGSGGGGMGAASAPLRAGSRSVSQSTRFSMGSNDDEHQDTY